MKEKDWKQEKNWNTLDFGSWELIDLEQHSSLEEVLPRFNGQRLGTILHAWGLPTGEMAKFECDSCGTSEESPIFSELIEHWCITLSIGGNRIKELDGFFYRYRLGALRNEGLVYRTLECALKSEDGVPLNDVLKDAMMSNLLLPGDRR